MNFVIDADRCVACLACVRVCPTDAIALVEDEPPVLQIVDESCVRCGQCVPSCQHDAVKVNGEIGRALAIAALGEGVLILSQEAAAHFYPATPEQLVNACYEAGFRIVSRGVIGDELVAAEYLKLWRDEPWGTLIRSTDPVIVDTIRTQYPELVPYLAPVTIPAVAEARYLRAAHDSGMPIVFADVCPPVTTPELDAAISFSDLEQLFRMRGVSLPSQPTFFHRVPSEHRRHLSAAGGLPLALLEEARQSSQRFRKLRGLAALRGLSRAVTVDRLDLGFVDILATEGSLDHPLSGPQDELWWRRALVASAEPPRSRQPVVDTTVVASVGAVFAITPRRFEPDPEAVAAVLSHIGLGPDGRPWDCQACGYESCRRFAESAALGRASLRQCMPYQERRADDAQRAAATDAMTGLSTYRVLRERLAYEAERCKRSGEHFAVLFLDLDRFKQVNDEFGHEAGNDILRAVAGEIRGAVRASDVAARYGGDEFVVILTRTDLQGAARVAEALRAGIEGVGRRLGYETGLVTVSVGLAEFDPRESSAADLLVAADRALYRAKASGRNFVAAPS
ncbi:MAG: diguanylate cyclase [Gemmatimonadales bacterium]|nr:diguanylate cyclase [Gemmatimonadales bacterium]